MSYRLAVALAFSLACGLPVSGVGDSPKPQRKTKMKLMYENATLIGIEEKRGRPGGKPGDGQDRYLQIEIKVKGAKKKLVYLNSFFSGQFYSLKIEDREGKEINLAELTKGSKIDIYEIVNEEEAKARKRSRFQGTRLKVIVKKLAKE